METKKNNYKLNLAIIYLIMEEILNLTYVQPASFKMGYESVTTLLDIIKGSYVEKIKMIPIKLNINQSCGCILLQIQKTFR